MDLGGHNSAQNRWQPGVQRGVWATWVSGSRTQEVGLRVWAEVRGELCQPPAQRVRVRGERGGERAERGHSLCLGSLSAPSPRLTLTEAVSPWPQTLTIP